MKVRVVWRDPLSPPANYALGIALEAQAKHAEALAVLDRAGDRIPEALLAEARILQSQSRVSEASATLRRYLAIRSARHREQAAAWLEELEARESEKP